MTSLITGGSGLMGVEVARLLLEQGEKPVVFSRNPSTPKLADVADHVEGIAGDLGIFSHVLNAVKKTRPDVIYHMGGMLSVPSDADPAGAIQANALGTFHVLEAARLFDVSQVLFTSSLGVYGADIKEDFIDDNTVQHPLLFYGATKCSRKTWDASTRENMGSILEGSGTLVYWDQESGLRGWPNTIQG